MIPLWCGIFGGHQWRAVTHHHFSGDPRSSVWLAQSVEYTECTRCWKVKP